MFWCSYPLRFSVDFFCLAISVLARSAVYGWHWTHVALFCRSAASLPIKLLMKSASVRGFFLFHFADQWSNAFGEIAHLYEQGKLTCAVDQGQRSPRGGFVGMEAVVDAVDYLYSKKNVGKVVVDLTTLDDKSKLWRNKLLRRQTSYAISPFLLDSFSCNLRPFVPTPSTGTLWIGKSPRTALDTYNCCDLVSRIEITTLLFSRSLKWSQGEFTVNCNRVLMANRHTHYCALIDRSKSVLIQEVCWPVFDATHKIQWGVMSLLCYAVLPNAHQHSKNLKSPAWVSWPSLNMAASVAQLKLGLK